MLLSERFACFVEESPISVMMRGIVENAFSCDRIDELFERTAESQYTRELPFSTVADLMAEVVFDISPSIGAAYQANAETISVSRKSVYNKLNGVEPGVSVALVHDSAKRFAPVIQRLQATLPSLLPGYRAKLLDGNHFSATEHRLEELRTIGAAPLPGKALVVLDPALKLATKVVPCEDGHAQERSLLDHILCDVEPGDLWIADRNFCTLKFLFGIFLRQGKFLIRQHASMPGVLVGKRKYKGRTDTGKVYEQRLQLTHPDTGRTLTVRRITIELDEPTRDGDTEMHLLTNVPVKDAQAKKLAEIYRKRWTIENHVSGYYITLEISKTYAGMMIAIPTEHWAVFRNLTAAQLAKVLKNLARHVVLEKYRKHTRGPKKPRPKRTSTEKENHVSTARIIAKRKSAH